MTHIMIPRRVRRLPVLAATLLLLCSCSRRDSPEPEPGHAPGAEPATQPAIVRPADGSEFDAIIQTPDPARRNGWGVLMMGGGFGNDLDWTVPGSIVIEGQSTQMTLSGQTHSDAPTISAALAERGFVVMRWSTIARNDPLADQWPARATSRTLPEMLVHARDALRTLRESGLIEGDRIILLGHSLGAARACTIASEDEGVRALILLAPAYFTRDAGALDSSGMRHGESVLGTRPIPCLALFGELDTSKVVDATGAGALAGSGRLRGLEVHVFPGLGHQLAPTQENRHGPVDPAVVSELARWAEQAARAG